MPGLEQRRLDRVDPVSAKAIKRFPLGIISKRATWHNVGGMLCNIDENMPPGACELLNPRPLVVCLVVGGLLGE
jgi:hypothetical protein